uniref:Uncharacterized protein n=1 Tax=uncultured alpha proteobacterium EF100_102A06 TaxID=710799 RepID=E0Y284_9PROT|nr:hypothetical protein [uncultured alpha proteobacterium EF100_102A06]
MECVFILFCVFYILTFDGFVQTNRYQSACCCYNKYYFYKVYHLIYNLLPHHKRRWHLYL